MHHVTNLREASEFPRPNVRLGKYRILSALSEKNFLFGKPLSARASESAHTGVVPSEISESGIMVLYRGILRFLIICFLSNLRSCQLTTRASRTPPSSVSGGVRAANAARREAQVTRRATPPANDFVFIIVMSISLSCQFIGEHMFFSILWASGQA